MNDDEAEKLYQKFLQREQEKEAQKGLQNLPKPPEIIPLTEEYKPSSVPVTPEQEARSKEIEEALKATMRKNLKDSFYIELQIACGNEKEVATNKKLRYEFAKKFVQAHWTACISAGLKIKDLLNV